MNEIQEIINAYDIAKAKAMPCVLATVVHLEGSSYRRPGARMLVLEDGLMIGAISGGCLEGDALKKAMLTFSEKNNRLITYDTNGEEDATIGVQLGCEGVIQVLFEYVNAAIDNNPIELLRKTTSQRQASVLVTFFDLNNKRGTQLGTKLLQLGKDKFGSVQIDNNIINALEKDIALVFENHRSVFQLYHNQISAFIEYVAPPISLVIIGAGNDAIPMSQIAYILGWDVKVVDGRQTHAKTDRFINACQVLVSKPEAVLEQITLDERTCFVLMTHNYNYDVAMLKALLGTTVPYIGVLGPKKKLHKMLSAIREEGVDISDSMLSRIFGPTGLDIGAENAGEIATSIIAEIQAVMNGKNAQMLTFKKDVIHS